MGIDPRLENYLFRLEKSLGAFSTSERAEIITEIKSHVLSALELDPNTPLDSILSALGEPEIVANRYSMERGLRLTKPPINPIVKWIVIGFLATLAMFFIFSGFVVYKLSPVIKVDGGRDYVSLLGGAIEISGEEGEVKFRGDKIDNKKSFSSKSFWLVPNHITEFEFLFTNEKIEFNNSMDRNIKWNCKGYPMSETLEPTLAESKAFIDLSSAVGVKCTLHVPANLNLVVKGDNGKLKFEEPQYNVKAQLQTGKVVIEPDKHTEYQYKLNVENGKVESFQSSLDPKAYEIEVQLSTGRISREK